MEIAAAIKGIQKKMKLLYFIETGFWILFIGAALLKCMYFQFTSDINISPFLDQKNIFMLLSTSGMVLTFTALLFLLFNRKRIFVVMLASILLAVVLIGDTIFFRYYRNLISVPVLFQIGLVDSIGGSIMSLFKLSDAILVVDIPIMIVGFIYLKKKPTVPIHFLKRAILAALVISLGYYAVHTAHKRAYTPSFILDNNYIAKYMGVFYYHYYDARRFVHDTFLADRKLTDAERKKIYEFYKTKPTTKNTYTDSAKGKNLIIIQVEALQEFLINRQINGKEITPNLNKLIKESLYFDNIYYQIADGNTSDAEFLTNVSLYPLKEGSVCIRYSGNEYPSLPSILKQKGYNTYALHANRPSFWNRSAFYKSIGFDKFYNVNHYSMDEKVGWGVSDSSFFRQSLEKIDTTKPFYGFFITLSSHFPYDFDYPNAKDIDTGKSKDSIIGDYITSENYSDRCLGEFIDNLKKRGLYDTSVIAIYGDHYGIPKDKAVELSKYLGTNSSEYEWSKLQKIPLIIHYQGLKDGTTINKTGGEIDILPTISNLMGLKAAKALGNDLLSGGNGYAVLRNGSLVTDKYIFIHQTGKAYDVKTGAILDSSVYREEHNSIMQAYELSQIIIRKNAFAQIDR